MDNVILQLNMWSKYNTIEPSADRKQTNKHTTNKMFVQRAKFIG